MDTNVLYYGDNLDILRRYLPDVAVDLVYLDPPFNANRDYNVIFRDESGKTCAMTLGDVLPNQQNDSIEVTT
jgi:16S rRNA G966 N2-methylase RsmD